MYIFCTVFTITIQYYLQKPLIDSSSDSGEKPDKFDGSVEFKHVTFSYPARPDVQVWCNALRIWIILHLLYMHTVARFMCVDSVFSQFVASGSY